MNVHNFPSVVVEDIDKENKSDDPAEDVPPAADGKSGNNKL